MKKFFSGLLLLCIMFSLSACKNNVVVNAPYYTIYVENGQQMIAFKSVAKSNKSQHLSGASLVEFPHFKSVEEMFETIKSGNLSPDKIMCMPLADKSIPYAIYSLDKPMDAQLPNWITTKEVIWKLDQYSLVLESSLYCRRGTLTCLTQSAYEEKFASEYDRYFDEQGIVSTTAVAERNATETVYTNGTGVYKLVRYEIVSGERTLQIQENYILEHFKPDLLIDPIVDGVPDEIEIFGVENDMYFYANLSGFHECPTEDWLSSFGLVPLEG